MPNKRIYLLVEANKETEPLLICGSCNTEKEGKKIALFHGGCGKLVPFSFAYRCGECTGFFHRHCLYEHFKHKSDGTDEDMRRVMDQSKRRAKKDLYPPKT